MSGHGGHRPGSGRKRIYSSQKERNKIWHRGHTRIALDNIVYSSWFSAKIKCGYSSQTSQVISFRSNGEEGQYRILLFTGNFLNFVKCFMCFKSKLYYFRQNDPVISCGKRKRSEEKEHLHNVTSKRLKRHIEGKNFAFIVIFFRSSVWYMHVLFIPCSCEKQKPNIFLEVSK